METQDRCIKNDGMNLKKAGKMGERHGLKMIYKMNCIHLYFVPNNFFFDFSFRHYIHTIN